MKEKDNKSSHGTDESTFPNIDLNAIGNKASSVTEKNIESNNDVPIDTESLANQLKQLDNAQKEAKSYQDERLAFMLEKAKEVVHLPANPIILYPGSNMDTTVADSFGKGQVLHLDLDNDAMQKLADADYKVMTGSSETYSNDEPYDLVVFWNSGITPDMVLGSIKVGGYVFANNHHDSASIISTKSNFELIGGIDQNAPTEIKDATEMHDSLKVSYMEVTREAKIMPLSKEEYEAAKLAGERNILSHKNGEDSLFIFRKVSENG